MPLQCSENKDNNLIIVHYATLKTAHTTFREDNLQLKYRNVVETFYKPYINIFSKDPENLTNFLVSDHY